MTYEGTVVLNYKLTQLLGEGGFGAVYLAEHQTLGRKAACKILHPQYARHTELVERFFREAKAVCAIGHRAIIDIENFGTLPSGERFYLMEYFPGEALADRIRRRPLVIEEIPIVFHPVVSALAAAHGLNIVHRDLKPDNVMMLEELGQIVDVKLLDFGIAKLVDTEDTVKSQTGAAMGTPTYMAPEQARDSKNVDQRADVYGFAATLYAAIAGRPPFVADNVTEIIVAVQTQRAPPLREFAPHAPPALEAVLARCLEKDPDLRPPTIVDVWNDILAAIGAPQPTIAPGNSIAYAPVRMPTSPSGVSTPSQPVAPTMAATPNDHSAPSVAPTIASSASSQVSTPTTLGSANGAVTTAQPGRSSRGAILAVVVVALLGGAAGAYAAFGGNDKAAAKAPPDPPAAADAAPIVAVADPPDAGAPGIVSVALDAAPPEPVPVKVVDKPKPSNACAKRAFDKYRGKKLSASKRKSILHKAKKCVASGDLSDSYYDDLVKALEPKKTPPPPPPPPPEDDCSVQSFARVYRASKPSEDAVRGALKRLRTCKSKLGATRYQQIQTALVQKL